MKVFKVNESKCKCNKIYIFWTSESWFIFSSLFGPIQAKCVNANISIVICYSARKPLFERQNTWNGTILRGTIKWFFGGFFPNTTKCNAKKADFIFWPNLSCSSMFGLGKPQFFQASETQCHEGHEVELEMWIHGSEIFILLSYCNVFHNF